MYEEKLMDYVIQLSRKTMEWPGTQPFGAIVVRDSNIVGEGVNREMADNDPTAHGEIQAIRDACRRLDTTDLSDCVLYAIGEPCPMCTVAIRLASVQKVYYGATHLDALNAYEGLDETPYADIGVESLRVEASLPVEERSTPYTQHNRDACAAVYWEWSKSTQRQLGLFP